MSAEHSPAIHWRLNPQRYRLEGIRFIETGEVSLQNRPVPTGNPNHIYNPPQEVPQNQNIVITSPLPAEAA